MNNVLESDRPVLREEEEEECAQPYVGVMLAFFANFLILEKTSRGRRGHIYSVCVCVSTCAFESCRSVLCQPSSCSSMLINRDRVHSDLFLLISFHYHFIFLVLSFPSSPLFSFRFRPPPPPPSHHLLFFAHLH